MLQLHRLAPAAREDARTHAREHRALPRRHASATRATASTAGSAAPRLVPGQLLGGRYRVVELVAEGGMGAVYRVFDRVLEHEVALKSVRGDDAILRDEVRLAHQVAHRNVCRTFDLEEIDGRHFLKMEYIPGESLASLLDRVRELPVARAVAIARAIAEGLAAAHARGIVHRDLKPANVMLDGDRVVLVDFGLAQPVGDSDCAGTPEYMSPEQLASAPIEASSDLYSLGCVVFEMLVGTPPFRGATVAEVIARRCDAALPDIRAHRSDVTRALAAAVRSLLAADPAQRAAGLAYFTERRRRRSQIAIASVAACMLLAGARAAAPAGVWEPTLVDLPQYDENADEPSLSPDNTAFIYSSDRGHRDSWAVYVAARDGGEPRRISPDGAFCVGARWTHDGRAVVMSCYRDGERRIIEQSIDGGTPRDLGSGGWSVDACGDRLAVVVARPTGAAIVLRDRDAHDVELARLPAVSAVRCDRRGARLVAIASVVGDPGSAGDLVVIDRATGAVRVLPEIHHVESATFTPDGDAIVFAMQRGGGTSLYEIAYDGGAIHELTPHEANATSPDVALDGASLVFDRDRTSIPLFELGPRGPVQRTFRFERLSHVLASPNDDTLVATRIDPDRLSVITIDREYRARAIATGEALAITRANEVAVSALDDRRRILLVPLAGGPARTLATLPARVIDAADGPDGLHVEIDRDGVGEAWRIGRDGAAAREGVAGLVVPAPDGRWRVIATTDGMRVTLRFVAPGHALADPSFERDAMWGQPAWIDARTFAYCDAHGCRQVDVETRRDVAVPLERPGNRPITVGRGGTRWFAASYVGHVSRHIITNLATRPWAQ
jgi:serine/threonine-protein kinase